MDPRSNPPEILTQKTLFLEKAAAAGLPVPQSRSVSSKVELVLVAKELGFPLIVKPTEGFAGNGISSIHSAAELDAHEFKPGVFSVQRLVRGRSGGTAILLTPEQAVWWQSSFRTKVWPEPYGPSTRRAFIHLPEMPRILEKLAPLLGMRGLCELEWILPDEGGPPQLIEFNPRPAAYLYLTDFMGGKLPEAIRAFLSNEPVQTCVTRDLEGIEYALFPEDAVQAAKQRDWRRLLAWMSGRAGPVFKGGASLVALVHLGDVQGCDPLTLATKK